VKDNPPKLIEGEDYYLNDEGLFVFTEKYLLNRGFCCHNGCRHCPYGYSPFKERQVQKPGAGSDTEEREKWSDC
jgi:urocanate hydratase